MDKSLFAKRGVLGIIAAFCLSSAASAQETAYLCEMKNYGQGYRSSDQYFVQFDQGAGTAFAYDGLIEYFNDKKAIQAKYKKTGNSRYEFGYFLDVTLATKVSTRMDFSVRFFENRQELMVSAKYSGYDNRGMGGRGKCKPVKPAESL